MKHGSFFSGIGLLDLGFERGSGSRPAFFAEKVEFRRKVLALRWPGVPIYEDVADAQRPEGERLDALIGGFVCKRISTANVEQERGLKGISGSTWELYRRGVERVRPRAVVVENAAKDSAWRHWLPTVRGDLWALGYSSVSLLMPSTWYGAVHHRERAFVFATDGHDASEHLLAVHEEMARLRAVPRPLRPTHPDPSLVGIDGGPHRVAQLKAIGDGVDVRVAEAVGRVTRAILEARCDL